MTTPTPPLSPAAQAVLDSPTLREIGERIRTQDNRCTADPIFQVRVRRRIYGMDPQWMHEPVWIDTEDGAREVEPPDDPDNPPEFVIQTGCIDVWEVKMVAFTEEGCKEHLRLNGHNYRHFQEVEIYADYLNRCPEMIAIRNALMALPHPDATALAAELRQEGRA
jgi:hypothetical protein